MRTMKKLIIILTVLIMAVSANAALLKWGVLGRQIHTWELM